MHTLAMILALSTIGANDFTVTTLGSGAAANAATTTSSDVTLAVSSTGNDNGGQPAVITGGDYSSMPFATIQAALDALPDLVCHDVEIDVGTGTFAGALVSKQGCAASPENYPWIRIYGTRAAATLASGSVSGTATSGGTSTLTLTGASWTVDDLQGRILYVTAGTGAGEYVIATNTTDTITIPAVVTFDSTSVFQLEDLATVINTPRGGGYTGGTVFEIYHNSTLVVLRDLKITYSDAAANGVFVSYSVGVVHAQRIVMSAASSYDGFKAHDGGELLVNNCGYLGASSNAAFSSYGLSAKLYYTGIMADVTGNGVRIVYGGELSDTGSGGFWLAATTNGVLLDDCNKTARVKLVNGHVEDAQNGIYTDNCTTTLDTIDIDGTTAKTIYAHESELIIDTALSGTGNVWGMDLSQPGGIVYMSITPTITGSSGEVTFDGTTSGSWADVVVGSPGIITTDNMRYSGKSLYGLTASTTDFPNARMIVSANDSGYNTSNFSAIVAEGKSSGGTSATGLTAVGVTSGSIAANGISGFGKASDAADTGNATGIIGWSFDTHNGANVGISTYATGGTSNYALQSYGGDFDTMFTDMDWDIKDNDPSALSIDTDGLSCLLCFDTTNGAEKISTGATLELGAALDANGNDILDGSGSLSLNDDVVVSGDLTVGGDTKLSTPADGDLLIANNGGTQGVVLGTADTDGALTLKNEAGSIGIDVVIGTRGLYFGSTVTTLSARVQSVSDYMNVIGYYGAQFKHIGDLTTASRGSFEFGQDNANSELAGSSGVQYGMSLGNTTVPFEVNQSGTAGYHALHIDVTETATGSGEKHLINVGVGGASKFSIDNGGELSASGISGDGSGKAVCIKADGNLGTCTDAVGAGGTCTCN